MLLLTKMAKFEFCYDYKGGSKPQDRFGLGLTGKLAVEMSYKLCRNFSASWSRIGAAVKHVFGKTDFTVGGIPLKFGFEIRIMWG